MTLSTFTLLLAVILELFYFNFFKSLILYKGIVIWGNFPKNLTDDLIF